MDRGYVYFDPEFRFSDGTVGEKRFVVLNSPAGDEPFLVVRTTSKIRDRNPKEGCNPEYGDFYIPGGKTESFPEDTLVQLIDIFPYSQDQLHKGLMIDKKIKNRGTLANEIIRQIVNCVLLLKDDISEKNLEMITRRD